MKWLSRKWLVTLCALILVAYIVFTKQSEFNSLAMLLAGEVSIYIGANTAQKAVTNKNKGEKENGSI